MTVLHKVSTSIYKIWDASKRQCVLQDDTTRNSEEWQACHKVTPVNSIPFVANFQPNRALNEWSNLHTHPTWFLANLLLFGAHSDNALNVGPFGSAYLHNPVTNQLIEFYLKADFYWSSSRKYISTVTKKGVKQV